MFGKDWDDGVRIAHFKCITNGPEANWEAEIRFVRIYSKEYWVVLDPMADRLMWFDNDRAGNAEAMRAFCNIVGLALCDADMIEVARCR